MALGRLPPAHLAACGCTQIGQIWIGSAALVPKQDRRQNGGTARPAQDHGRSRAVTRAAGGAITERGFCPSTGA
jgi:hypothetical protein